jgi:hypothetical protein
MADEVDHGVQLVRRNTELAACEVQRLLVTPIERLMRQDQVD